MAGDVPALAAVVCALDALDQIVTQVPGLVWVVTYDPGSPGEDVKVGLLCPDGYFGRTTVSP